MACGLEWIENSGPTFDSQNDNIAAYAPNSHIEHVLQKDMVTTPGTQSHYNSGCPTLPAGIVSNPMASTSTSSATRPCSPSPSAGDRRLRMRR